MTCKLLLISGSTRDGSTNTATLRTAAAVAPDGIETTLYPGIDSLPHFNPDDDPDGGTPPPAIVEFRAALAAVDGILFCTPEYAGGMPGSFKNLLDWTVGGGETYEMPVAWVNTSPRGATLTHESLRHVLGYTHSDIVEDACAHVPVTRDAVGADGLVANPAVRAVLAASLTALAARVAERG